MTARGGVHSYKTILYFLTPNTAWKTKQRHLRGLGVGGMEKVGGGGEDGWLWWKGGMEYGKT